MKSKVRPNIFIGSSSEGLKIARALQLELDYSADTQIWSQGVFGLSTGTLETLCEKAETFDFAILVLTPDDMLAKRNCNAPAPRDNVVFELGLFMGAIGRKRTYIVHQRGIEIALPTDLAGITTATFFMQNSGNLGASIGAAATQIVNQIEAIGIRLAPAKIQRGLKVNYKLGENDIINTGKKTPTNSTFPIKPTSNRVIAELKWSNQKVGSIIIPKEATEPPNNGTVMAVGDEVERTKTGDNILWNKYAGEQLKLAEKYYIMVREEDITGIIQ